VTLVSKKERPWVSSLAGCLVSERVQVLVLGSEDQLVVWKESEWVEVWDYLWDLQWELPKV